MYMVCEKCGSEDISKKGILVWNCELREWVLIRINEDCYCEDCEEPCSATALNHEEFNDRCICVMCEEKFFAEHLNNSYCKKCEEMVDEKDYKNNLYGEE